MGAFSALGLAITLTRGGKAEDSTAPPVPARLAPAPNPAAQAKESLAAITERVAARFYGLPKEPLPAATKHDWGFDSALDTTFRGELAPDPFVNLASDTREMRSPAAPYRGLLVFGAKVTGRMAGTLERRTTYQFDFDAEVGQDGVAEYAFQDGRWVLTEVRLTIRDFRLTSREPSDKNLWAALTADELNKNPSKVTGKTTRLGPNSDLGVVRLFREAATK